MQKSMLYKTDGTVVEVEPGNGRSFSYLELSGFVGGMIEIVPLPDGREIVVNENGKLEGLPVNPGATALWKQLYPIDKYPHNNDELIVGDALVCDTKFLEDDDGE